MYMEVLMNKNELKEKLCLRSLSEQELSETTGGLERYDGCTCPCTFNADQCCFSYYAFDNNWAAYDG